MSERLVVVGASLAGLRAIEAARRLGFVGPITLVGAEPHLPYDRPPLSKAVLNPGLEADIEPFRSREHLKNELGVELILGEPATALDTAAKVLHTRTRRIGYSNLIIATGGSARQLPNTDGISGVHTLRTKDDALAVRAALDAGARVAVVGAGFIGSEVASAARKRGLDVTIIEMLPVPLTRSVGPFVGAVCAEIHAQNGVDLRFGVGVERLLSDSGKVTGVVLTDDTIVPADLVVVGVGVDPATAWLEGSGVKLHPRDRGVVCDSYLRSSAAGVFAAGDVAHWTHPLFDYELMRLEHWTSAAEHGATAARNALFPTTAVEANGVPYFWSDWYEHRIQFVGIPNAEDVDVVDDGTKDGRFLAFYRRGDRLVGVLTIDRPTQIMKFRKLIADRDRVEAAKDLAITLG
ncbi:MAG: pyridine nucleotide-disulfide oxidoreductase [Marmoricola sp.]|nr:pyridine nucleotide-disulfide oxidoreductase [Marmoricola sp.]